MNADWRDVGEPVQSVDEIVSAFSATRATVQGETEVDSRGPLLVRIPIPDRFAAGEQTVEFRLIRPESTRFWLVTPAANQKARTISSRSVRTEKGGFAIDLPANTRGAVLYGEIQSFAPWKPKIFVWSRTAYETSTFNFERQGGALIGSLLILSLFSGIVALLNREFTFLLFSGWLIASVRIAAINGGWDNHWIGLELSEANYLVFLRVSMAAYGFLTAAIFRSLFVPATAPKFARMVFGAVQGSFVVLMLCLPVLSYTGFLKCFWLLSAASLSSIAAHLTWSIFTKPTRVAAWYLASWATMIAGMLSEIGFQAGVNQIPVWINSQSGAVVSALMMSIALADKLKTEREARMRAQARSLKYLRKYEQNYNSMPVGLFSISSTGNVRLHNPAFESMFASSARRDELTGTIDSLLGEGTFDRMKRTDSSDQHEIEICTLSANRSDRWFLLRYASIDDGFEGSIQNITTRKLAEAKLRHLVDHDSLTGLLNRRGLDVALKEAATRVLSGVPCAIAYVEMDRFKLFNDLHGHAVGDTLLQETAQRLVAAVRTSDKVARLADAFLVILIDCPDHAVNGLSERMRSAVGDRPFEIDGKGLNLTASVGVVRLDASMSSIDAVAAADRACLEAKARGRNCVVRLTDQDESLRAHLEELRVVADLQKHIPTERYFLEFQPIVALQSAASTLSYEVLIRMRGDHGQVIPPGKFIGAAERNGLMSQIDRWVLRSTLEWLDDHPEHRDLLSFATINISGASLNDNRFVDDAFSMIAEHPMAMPKLCFEITESVALHDLGSTRRFVDRVRMYGSKLALDDFGAGYTSFNYLKEIPADFIKIDGSFVKDINRNPANFAITRTIVELTHELGMRSIAEWAETPDTIAALIELGVDYGQGFGLVRPIAPSMVSGSQNCLALVPDPVIVQMLRDRAVSTVAPHSRIKLRPLAPS
ncbi:MAG: EAL domain-containing protein [Burkholderiales bacterium]